MAKSPYTWEQRIAKSHSKFVKLVIERGEDECWGWSGAVFPKGYGQFCGNNAHRAAYYYANGPFDKTLQVLHKCDNPPCTNPKHLFLGTNLENIADKMAKGRHKGPRGEQCAQHSLTQSQVLQIRALWETGQFMQKDLAMMFNIGDSAIQKIVTRSRWAHV